MLRAAQFSDFQLFFSVRIAMNRMCIIFLIVTCASWNAASTTKEPLMQSSPTDLESMLLNTSPSQEVLEPEPSSIAQQATNEEPEFLVPTTYPTESMGVQERQESIATENDTTGQNVQKEVLTLSLEDADASTTATDGDADNTELTTLDRETHSPTNRTTTIVNYANIESIHRTTHPDGATPNPETVTMTTPRIVDHPQTTIIPHDNVTMIQPQILTVGVSSTSSEATVINNSQNVTQTDHVPTTILPIVNGTEDLTMPTTVTTYFFPVSDNSVRNISERITTVDPKITSIKWDPHLSGLSKITEEPEESTVESVVISIPTTTRTPTTNKDSVTITDYNDLQNNNASIADSEEVTTEDIEQTAEEIFETKTSNTEDVKTTTTEVQTTETFQTYTIPSSTERLELTSQSNVQINLHNKIWNTYCNSSIPCSGEEICVLQFGECVCMINSTAFLNMTICQYEEEAEKTHSNGSVSINQNILNSTSGSDPVEHQCTVVTFLTKKWVELSSKQKSRNVVTITFGSAPEIVEWFQSYDWKFRNYVATTLTAWMHRTAEHDNCIITPTDIVYIAPSPTREDDKIVVSFLVRNPLDAANDSFLDKKTAIGRLHDARRDCELELQLSVYELAGEFPLRQLDECTNTLAGLTVNGVKLMFIGAVISLALVILVLLVFTMKCRQVRGRFDTRSGLYRHPRVLMRSPGDGHNLATDEQCQQGEVRRRDPENGNVTAKADLDTWVVPLEDEEAVEKVNKSINVEDTKV